MAQKDKPAETPLVILEKEIEAFKKDIDEKIKKFSKIEFKPKNLDKDKYKESVDDAQKQLKELKDQCDNFTKRIDELKKENEDAKLKDKDFDKRKNNENKKIKEFIKKIDKVVDKFKQDATKLEKLENEEAKKANKISSGKSIGSLASILMPKKDEKKDDKKNEKKEENKKKEDSEDDEDEDDEDEDDVVEDLEKTDDKSKGKEEVKGLKTLMGELAKSNKGNKDEKSNSNTKQNDKKVKSEDEDEDEEYSDNDKTDLKASTNLQSENEDDKVLKTYENQLKETNEGINQVIPNAVIKKNESSKNNKDEPKSKSESIKNHDYKKRKDVIDNNQDNTDDDVDESEEDEEEDDEESLEENISPRNEIKQKINDNDDDDDDIDDDYDYEVGTKFMAIDDFTGEQKGDLSFKEKEILTLVQINDKNWYLVKNEKGKEGLVPKNFLQLVKGQKEFITQKSTDSARSGLELWGLVKESIQNKTLLDPEALKATGLVPGSFSTSALEKMSHDLEYSYMHFLTPKLTKSNLMFDNFFWELKANKLRNRIVTLQKIITINKCTHIPVLKTNELEILGRFIRVCLFDGKKALSNIHIIRAHVEDDETTWLFDNEVNESTSIIECSEFFIRSQLPTFPSNLGILFELSMHAIKKSTKDETHLGCGWVHLPFIDDSKNIIQNKGYDLILNGGNIFDEKGKPLNEDLARLKPNPSLLDNIIDKLFRESKIKFDVGVPKDAIAERLNSLPEPLVSSTILVPFMKYFLEEIGLNLLKPLVEAGAGISQIDTSPIHSPFLASFMKCLNYPDILDSVKYAFNMKKGLMTRDQKNDDSYRRKVFVELFTKIAYPILHHSSMPEIQLYNDKIMEARDIIIERHWQAVTKNTILKSLLNENEEFEPFDVNEISYENLNEYSY